MSFQERERQALIKAETEVGKLRRDNERLTARVAEIDEQHTKDKFFLAGQVKELSTENYALKNRVAELEGESSARKLSHPLSCEGISQLLDQIKETNTERDALKAQVEKLNGEMISAVPEIVTIRKLEAQVEKLQACLQESDVYIPLPILLKHGMWAIYDENHSKPTPLLTGEGESQ